MLSNFLTLNIFSETVPSLWFQCRQCRLYTGHTANWKSGPHSLLLHSLDELLNHENGEKEITIN
jgi:hypothetical protein